MFVSSGVKTLSEVFSCLAVLSCVASWGVTFGVLFLFSAPTEEKAAAAAKTAVPMILAGLESECGVFSVDSVI